MSESLRQDQAPLNIATLRVTGPEAVLDGLIAKLRLNVVSRVRAGDPRRRGGIHTEAGISVSIADAASPNALMVDIRRFIQDCLTHGTDLLAGSDAELAVGISVGDSVQFVASIDLLPADVRDLAAIGMAFSVAAYPPSDSEENQFRPLPC